MKTLKVSKNLEAANAMLHPDLSEGAEDYTAQERRQLAAVYKDWAQQLTASAHYLDGENPPKLGGAALAKLAGKAGVELNLHAKFTNRTAEQMAEAGRIFERWSKKCAVSALLISGPAAEARN